MAEVVALPVSHLDDIATLMEAVAAEVRNGDIRAISGAGVLLTEHGEVHVFGWGRTDDVHAIGLLHLGIDWLAGRKTASS
jgi:hypothetical protein